MYSTYIYQKVSLFFFLELLQNNIYSFAYQMKVKKDKPKPKWYFQMTKNLP